MDIHNSTGLEMTVIEALPRIGTFRSNWRGRTVSVYDHPDPASWNTVITVGVGEHETVVCAESRNHYAQRITRNDWSDDNRSPRYGRPGIPPRRADRQDQVRG
jgi:hypothetical protein